MDHKPFDNSDNKPRVVRFKPKARKKTEQTIFLLNPKKEENDCPETTEKLLRRCEEVTSSSVRPKPERKVAPVEVAFGIGASSRTFKSYGSGRHIPASSIDGDASRRALKEYKEPWDYYSNYPVVHPIRRPYAGNPEELDEEEFGDDAVGLDYAENDTNAAEELGLLDKDSENTMLFLKLPSMLPTIAQPADSEVPVLENKKNPSKGPSNRSEKFTKLESLPEGLLGKMLVYKSGAVKLKIGDIIYDVSAGQQNSFAQDAVAINLEKKHCCNLGEITKRAIATPDIESMLDSISLS